MAEAHRDATLRVGAVLEAGELALLRIGGVVRSVCPGIVVVERVWRVFFLGESLSRVMLCLDLIAKSARGADGKSDRVRRLLTISVKSEEHSGHVRPPSSRNHSFSHSWQKTRSR